MKYLKLKLIESLKNTKNVLDKQNFAQLLP